MSAKYEELVKAGAPRLPEGHYYKIDAGRVPEVGEVVVVDVMRARSGWWDKRLIRRSEWAREMGNGVESLADLCARAHAEVFPDLVSNSWLAPFIGRHP